MADLLLDTSVLILHLREGSPVTDFLLLWGEHDALWVSVVTRVEILAGMRPHEEDPTMELLASLQNLAVTEAVADRAARLIYDAARRGIQASFPDALIAATALEHGLTVVTTNTRHYEELGASARQFSEDSLGGG